MQTITYFPNVSNILKQVRVIKNSATPWLLNSRALHRLFLNVFFYQNGKVLMYERKLKTVNSKSMEFLQLEIIFLNYSVSDVFFDSIRAFLEFWFMVQILNTT